MFAKVENRYLYFVRVVYFVPFKIKWFLFAEKTDTVTYIYVSVDNFYHTATRSTIYGNVTYYDLA